MLKEKVTLASLKKLLKTTVKITKKLNKEAEQPVETSEEELLNGLVPVKPMDTLSVLQSDMSILKKLPQEDFDKLISQVNDVIYEELQEYYIFNLKM